MASVPQSMPVHCRGISPTTTAPLVISASKRVARKASQKPGPCTGLPECEAKAAASTAASQLTTAAASCNARGEQGPPGSKRAMRCSGSQRLPRPSSRARAGARTTLRAALRGRPRGSTSRKLASPEPSARADYEQADRRECHQLGAASRRICTLSWLQAQARPQHGA